MTIRYSLFGIPGNLTEALERAKHEGQKSVGFSLEMRDISLNETGDSQKYRAKMYLSREDGSGRTKVFQTTSDLFTLTGLIPEQGAAYHEFEESLMRQRNRIRAKVQNAGLEFKDSAEYRKDPLEAGM